MECDMTNNVNEVLKALNESILCEKNLNKLKLNRNIARIDELSALINSLRVTNIDDQVFMPRKNKLVDQNMLEIKRDEYIAERNELESENEILKRDIDIADERINELQEVISVDPFLNRFVFLDMQENERQRIARDLHDSPLQNLTHLIHAIELSALFIDQDPERAKLELMLVGKKIRMIIEDIRNTIYDLRPMVFDDIGFKGAMQNMIDHFKNESNIFIDLIMENDIIIKNDLIYSNIYRIIRECVTNSIKHSEAKEIKIIIKEENNVCYIEVDDDGRGFDIGKDNKKHFGLQILEERVQLLKGWITIESRFKDDRKTEPGTEIMIGIPIE